MSYPEFVWFLMSEEDKKHPTRSEFNQGCKVPPLETTESPQLLELWFTIIKFLFPQKI